jgi:HEAT repeat protein
MLAPPPLPRKLDAAIRDLSSARGDVRASAIGDLVAHALSSEEVRARALPLLEGALKGDEAPEARAAAAVGLGDLRADEALPALLVAIEDANVNVRQMALNALGEIGDYRAAARLERALSDARPEVRYQAVIAYAKVARDPADVSAALARACNDADDAVRYIAFRIAEERTDAPRFERPSAAVLAEARARIESDASHVSLAAAILVAKVGEEPLGGARKALLRVVRGERLGGHGPDKEDEREAVELAGAIGLREAVPDLERRAWGLGSLVRDTCAWHAQIALARMEHPRAVAEILRDLDSKKESSRAAAIVAAGRAKVRAARGKLEALRGSSSAEADLVRDALAQLQG